MKKLLTTFLAPAYLLACIVFGGSQQSVWSNAALQIVALGLLFWIAVSPRTPPPTRSLTIIAVLVLLTFVTVGLQLVPLPPSIWASLPGRQLLVTGYRNLGMPLPWLPVSVTPYYSVIALFAFLPPLAMLASVQLIDDKRLVAAALLVGTAAGILLGQLQVGSGDQWRFYEFSNPGPVGFFANINHMGTLLLVSLPFAVAFLVGQSKPARAGYRGVVGGFIGLGLALLLVGVVLNGSLAALLLVGPVLLASAMMLPIRKTLRKIAFAVAGATLIGAVYILSSQPLDESGASISVASRQQIWGTTAKAIADSLPVGTGLGSFQQRYRQYEDPGSVSTVYVNHAHNDYLEVALEFGLPGLLLLLAFLGWWVWQSLRIWKSPHANPLARAATIASATILAHSIVDYPLRTAAITAVFGMCIALMVRQPRKRGDTSRHVTIG